ncbi:O-antigen polymerase [Cyanobacterium sp. Dongsha4]|uniref:O-antigen polymerase n=1 Tax=Cyanobacterium sp. DS4 TaxID=2878255 RepID=UPI002E810E2D|nr:O-antigen polymerase [Cyanobacterium sp. Dongsha4]WVK99934.1 oligosaccharide repeat unit polymerase [Cyanobacterium sp. Dongsha4]
MKKTNSFKNNPFVSISPGLLFIIRIFLGILFLIKLLDIFLSPHSSFDFTSLIILINFLLSALPLILKPSYGLFHPLIFGFLLSSMREIPETINKLTGLMMGDVDAFGFFLPYNLALIGWSSQELSELQLQISFYEFLALVSYYAGFFLFKVKGYHRDLFTVKSKLYEIKALAIITFSFILFIWFIHKRGGLIAHLLSWAGGRTQSITAQGDAIFVPFIQLGLVACLLWFALDKLALIKPWFWVSVGLSMSISFLTNGSRSGIIIPVGTALCIWMLREQKMIAGKILIYFFLGLIALGLLGNFRSSISSDKTINWNALTDINEAIESTFGSQDDSESSKGELVKRAGTKSSTYPLFAFVPETVDYLYGYSYLAIPTTFIPRSIWPDKPRAIGGIAGKEFFNSPAGIPPGNVGEAYWNFGVLGIVIIFILFGIFHRYLVKTYTFHAGKPGVIFLYLLTLTSFSPGSGPIIGWMLKFFPSLILLWLFGMLKFKRKQSQILMYTENKFLTTTIIRDKNS